jgi:hypothetical protein
MDVVMIDDLSGGELLDHVADLAARQHRCEVEIIRAAVQHAYLRNGDTVDPARAAAPGREQARRIAGAGAPQVSEFAAAELGARLGVSTITAGLLMADGLDLVHRLPQLWRRVEAGEVRVHLARLVARKTRDLTPQQTAYVDDRIAPYADGRLTWSRFETVVDGLVVAADEDAAAERERREAQRQFARPTHDSDDGGGHGMGGFFIRAPLDVIRILDATLDRLAQVLAQRGDTDLLERRRVRALLLLCRPDLARRLVVSTSSTDERCSTEEPVAIDWSALKAAVTVYLHVYGGPDSDGVARVEGAGAVTERWIRQHLSPHAKVTVRPVFDLAGQAPVDSYEIPERHRRAVHLMTPADTFPFSSSLDPSQVDHTEPYRHGPESIGAGQSRVGNYGPMTTAHHRLKTFGRWQVEQPFAGIYLWRDPHGALYLVDHSGTRALGRAA